MNVQRRNFQLRSGGNLDPEYVERVITEQGVLRQLINSMLVKQKAKELGFASSDVEFMDRLRSNPVFQTDGEFDLDQYLLTISRAGYSPSSYETTAREDFVVERLLNAQENTLFVTDRGTSGYFKVDDGNSGISHS